MMTRQPFSAIFRADASEAEGAGRVTRLLALAEELRGRGGRAIFAVGDRLDGAATLVAARGFEAVPVAGESGGAADIKAILALKARVAARVCFVDGAYPAAYYNSL